MEWEELKNTWKQITDAETPQYEVSEHVLLKVIRQRSSSLTAKMLRNVYGEIAFSAFCMLVLIFNPFPWYFRLASTAVAAILFSPFVKPFIRFYRLLKNFSQKPIENLHTTLHAHIDLCTQYVHWYRRMNLILTPLAGFGVIWLILYFYITEKIIAQLTPTVIIITSLIAVGYALLCIPLVNWYVNRLYGQHLDKLKACLKDLEEKNTESV